jgi:hypothetical protein
LRQKERADNQRVFGGTLVDGPGSGVQDRLQPVETAFFWYRISPQITRKGGDLNVQSQRLETTDIYKSAVFLCNGGRLAGMRFTKRRKGIVSFMIEGEGIFDLDLDYRNGTAQVNALKLRHTLNHLRDALFTRLREENPATRKRYAETRGRTNNDRPREDRCGQARR